MQIQEFNYSDADTLLKGAMCKPAGDDIARPTVLLCHDWTGITDFTKNKAKQLAELGYVGIALDIYGNGTTGKDNDEKMALIQPFMQDRAKLQQRLLAGLTAAQNLSCVDNNKIAVIGYCFGGLCALDLARSGANIQGAVSVHGLLQPPEGVSKEKIQAKVLALHGFRDPMVSAEDVRHFEQEMLAADIDWQVNTYGIAMHAFTNPLANDLQLGTVYNERVEKRAAHAIQHFLHEVFSN